MNSLLSKATVSAVGLLSKAFLNVGYCSSVTVVGIENLRHALESEERRNGRGVITISNHISTLDDPVVWGILPARWYLSSRMTRWTLGASDIMFTNPVFSAFFRKGQVLETFRGNGIFQPAIDTAVKKLNEGAWIQLFGEGKVNQLQQDRSVPSRLPRFKWGVGRIVMEAVNPPVIIPMWLTGFDKLMPEGRSAPFKFFPKSGVALSVTFGKPIDLDVVRDALRTMVRHDDIPESPRTSHGGVATPQRIEEETESASAAGQAWLGNATFGEASQKDAERREVSTNIQGIRIAVTSLMHRHVEALGKEVAVQLASSKT